MDKHKIGEESTLFFNDTIEFLEVAPIIGNPMISKVKIRIARAGKGNQYFLTKETLERAVRESLGLTPIIAYFNFYKDDFGEHNTQAVYNEMGEFITIGETRPLGVVPENPEVYWDDEGFLVTFGYLWTELYKEALRALEGKSQSMELSKKHTVFRPMGDGLIEIVDTVFQALCILGDDTPPAFEGASIKGALSFSKSKETIDKIDKGVDVFMKDLQFALQNNFEDADLVVDVDGEERDIENRKKITDAIDTLDEVAEESETPENVGIIDDAITLLVDAEMEMKREANIIPATEAAQKALQGTVDGSENIISTDDLNYKAKKSNSLIQPKDGDEEDIKEEEKELATIKKKEDEKVVVQEEEQVDTTAQPTKEGVEVVEQAPQEQVEVENTTETEEVVENTEEAPSDDEGIEEQSESTEAVDEESDTEAQAEDSTPEMAESGIPIQTGSEEETNSQISAARQTAASKRTSNLLSELSDTEVFEALVDRIEATEDIKARLAEVLGTQIGNELPTEGEIPEIAGETSIEETGNGEEVTDGIPSPENSDVPSEEAAVDEAEEVSETSDTEVETSQESEEIQEASPVQEDRNEEDGAETPSEDDEDKKKKKAPNFSLDIHGETVDVLELIKENLALQASNKELLEFKLNIEAVEKESVLAEFSISDETKDAIRLEFSSLSIEEVENKAIIAQYKEDKKDSGQKESDKPIIFSSVEEDADQSALTNKKRTALQEFLEAEEAKRKK